MAKMVYKPREIAECLGYTHAAVMSRIHDGRPVAVKNGGRYFITQRSLIKFAGRDVFGGTADAKGYKVGNMSYEMSADDMVAYQEDMKNGDVKGMLGIKSAAKYRKEQEDKV
jgi:hypothetical protein